MKRGKPLERRTPLKVRKQLQNTPLKAARQMLRRTPLKQVSARRQAENKVRRQVIATAHPDGPTICAVPWCDRIGDSPHEPLTRARGGSITDPDNIVMICWPHNQELTLEPEWGPVLGLLIPSWGLPPWAPRLARKIDASLGPDACWPWTDGCNEKGYGLLAVNRRPRRAHRLTYEIAKGVTVDRLTVVRHRCDNPPCCNPAHLVEGTPKANSTDMVIRHRSAWGERSGAAKLTTKQIGEIRAVYTGEWGQQTRLAEQYGVAPQTIGKIVNGRRRSTEPELGLLKHSWES